MSRVLQVLEIFEIWICHIFEFRWPPKVTSTLSKRPLEHDGDVIEGRRYNKVYLNITDNYYLLVHVKIRLD